MSQLELIADVDDVPVGTGSSAGHGYVGVETGCKVVRMARRMTTTAKGLKARITGRAHLPVLILLILLILLVSFVASSLSSTLAGFCVLCSETPSAPPTMGEASGGFIASGGGPKSIGSPANCLAREVLLGFLCLLLFLLLVMSERVPGVRSVKQSEGGRKIMVRE
jgi:hypothetical protein